MALHLLPSEEIRTACRQRIEACELWLRRLVHDKFHGEFGDNYVESASLSGQAIFRTEIRKHIAARRRVSPSRYARPVDALQLDHLASIICKHDVYRKYFKAPFESGFPIGNDHLRLIISRLVPARNALSHANQITIHDAERVLCYCSDIMDSLTHYYAGVGMDQDFNAPSFTRYSDSVGNVEHPTSTNMQFNFINGRTLREGEALRLEVEVDSHFPPDEYTIQWQVANISAGESAEGNAFHLTLQPRHVGMTFSIGVTVKSNKAWHRHGNFDAMLVLNYRVLPLT